jgi:uncharacterized protein (DUF3084 family)
MSDTKDGKPKTTPEPRPLKDIMGELERAVGSQERANDGHEKAKGELEKAVTAKKDADKRVRSLKKELDLALRGKA